MPHDPTTKQEVLRICREEARRSIGESPPGSNINEYTRWYFGNATAAPWCAIGQCWVENKAGGLLMPKTAYTPTMAQFFIDEKRSGKEPRVGALSFHNFPDSLNRIQHVERVMEIISPTAVRTIGFNTSSGGAGSQDDGGDVYWRERRVSSSDIVMFGYPLYEEDIPKFFFPKERTWLGRGDSGADVKLWQLDLNRWIRNMKNPPADFHLEITKRFDDDTVKATKTFQHHYDLDVDGRVGKHTLRKMERIRDRQEAA